MPIERKNGSLSLSDGQTDLTASAESYNCGKFVRWWLAGERRKKFRSKYKRRLKRGIAIGKVLGRRGKQMQSGTKSEPGFSGFRDYLDGELSVLRNSIILKTIPENPLTPAIGVQTIIGKGKE